MIRYNCSNGEKVSQATINKRRSETYRKMYEGEPHPVCAGCGLYLAQGSAHLLPQSVVKSEGLTELCWSAENIVPCCHLCNSKLESYKSDEIKGLYCYDQLLAVTKKYLPERYNKVVWQE